MAKRSHESPMDFEWQTRAPGDTSSPFYKLSMEHESRTNKRPFSAFESPQKSSTFPPQETKSQPSLFSQPPKTPTTASRNPAFMTPRKLDFEFSSGAEDPSSPENHADNDETPEQTSKSDRRNSLFNFYGRFAPSPGRGEIPRSNKLSNVVIRRVQKRRKKDREIERHRRRMSDDSDHDERYRRQEKPARDEPQKTHEIPFFSRCFTFLESHPHIPRILSFYAQFAFNLVLAFLALYVVVAFLMAIKYDITRLSDQASSDIVADMEVCAKQYLENRCSGEDGRRLPALESVCDNWARCMNQDPSKVGRAKVSAQTLAEVFNSFIEPISFKSMFFIIASVATCMAVSNLSFSWFRNKSGNPPEPMPSAYQPFHAPDMQRHPSQLGYTPGRPAFGMDPSYYGHHPMYNPNSFNMSPKKPNDERDERQLQIEASTDYRDRTRSPSKRERMFS